MIDPNANELARANGNILLTTVKNSGNLVAFGRNEALKMLLDKFNEDEVISRRGKHCEVRDPQPKSILDEASVAAEKQTAGNQSNRLGQVSPPPERHDVDVTKLRKEAHMCFDPDAHQIDTDVQEEVTPVTEGTDVTDAKKHQSLPNRSTDN